jgi:DHA1 family multidrug resistance protein-like MFS transporter
MLSRRFLVVGLSMMMATLGLGAATPIIPIFVGEMGGDDIARGLAYPAFTVTQLAISPFVGRLADRYGRKWFLAFGLFTYAITAMGWFYSDSVLEIVFFRAFSGIGSALIFPMSQSYIGALAPKGSEGRYMGTFNLFDFVGFGLGPLLAGILRDYTSIDLIFLSMTFLFALATLMVVILLPAEPQNERVNNLVSHHKSKSSLPFASEHLRPSWSQIIKNPLVQGIFSLRASVSCAIGVSFTFIPVLLEEDLGTSSTAVGLLIGGQQFMGGAVQPLMGMFADKYSKHLIALIGSVLMASSYWIATFSDTYWILLITFVVGAGLGSAMSQVVAATSQVQIGRTLGLSTVASIQSMAFAIGILIGSAGGGVIAEILGRRFTFALAGIVIIAGYIIYAARSSENEKIVT